MKLKQVLHQRQYKIQLSSEVSVLDLKYLNAMGIWSHPMDRHYLLTLKSSEDPNVDPIIFEKIFREKTGLSSNEAKIESSYGPLTFQNAVDSSWV